MGGPGSGRKPDPMKFFNRPAEASIAQVGPGADNALFLPNFGGLREGVKKTESEDISPWVLKAGDTMTGALNFTTAGKNIKDGTVFLTDGLIISSDEDIGLSADDSILVISDNDITVAAQSGELNLSGGNTEISGSPLLLSAGATSMQLSSAGGIVMNDPMTAESTATFEGEIDGSVVSHSFVTDDVTITSGTATFCTFNGVTFSSTKGIVVPSAGSLKSITINYDLTINSGSLFVLALRYQHGDGATNNTLSTTAGTDKTATFTFARDSAAARIFSAGDVIRFDWVHSGSGLNITLENVIITMELYHDG